MNLKEYSMNLTIILDLLKEFQDETSIEKLMDERAYIKQEQRDFLTQVGIFKTKSSDFIVKMLDERNLLDLAKQLKVVNENDYFILEDRYIIPVLTINNKLISLIGWAREWHDTKYITIPSPHLDTNIDWFGLPYALENYTDYIVVVEGIFDCLSLNALGIPTIAMMGADFPYSKSFILQAFKRVIAIPDNDRIGKANIENWRFAKGTQVTFVDLRGEIQLNENTEPIRIKEIGRASCRERV